MMWMCLRIKTTFFNLILWRQSDFSQGWCSDNPRCSLSAYFVYRQILFAYIFNKFNLKFNSLFKTDQSMVSILVVRYEMFYLLRECWSDMPGSRMCIKLVIFHDISARPPLCQFCIILNRIRHQAGSCVAELPEAEMCHLFCHLLHTRGRLLWHHALELCQTFKMAISHTQLCPIHVGAILKEYKIFMLIYHAKPCRLVYVLVYPRI